MSFYLPYEAQIAEIRRGPRRSLLTWLRLLVAGQLKRSR